jgi:hypothetical protein
MPPPDLFHDKKGQFRISLRPTKTFFTMILVVTCVVLIWRGIWNLLDIYFLRGHPILSNVVGILIGVIILYLPDRDIKDLL